MSDRPSRTQVEPEQEEAVETHRFNAHLHKPANMTMRTATVELRLSRPSDLLNLMLEAYAEREAAGEKDPFFEDVLERYRARKAGRKQARPVDQVMEEHSSRTSGRK